MTFPTPFTVSHEVFNGTGVDDLGNDVEAWASPVPAKVIGWYSSAIETLLGHTSRVVADIDLLIPPTLEVSVRDRFSLPNDADTYEVVAIEDYTHGFHQWQPGLVVKLKKATG